MKKKYIIGIFIILLALVTAGSAWRYKKSTVHPPRPAAVVCGKPN